MQKLSESEYLIMQAVWELGHPVTSAELVALFADTRGWKPQTVSTFLSRLTEKGMLSCTRKGVQNIYEAAVEEAAYRAQETRSFLTQVHKGSVKSLFAALCDNDGLSAQELDELKEWLARR